MRSSHIFSLFAVVGLSVSQKQYSIDPNSVPQSTRDTWCDNQKTQCPLICLQVPGVTSLTTNANDCDPNALTYNCVCENNVRPNVTQYTQTLPYYICTEYGNQCVAKCNNVNTCQDNCRKDNPCGATDPPKGNATSSSSITTATATGAQASKGAPTGFGVPASTTAAKAKGAASTMTNLGQSYGLALIFAGVFAGFTIIL